MRSWATVLVAHAAFLFDGNEYAHADLPDCCAAACCRTNGSCDDNVEPEDCEADSGRWQGFNSTCAERYCHGACCQDGACTETSALGCVDGEFLGMGTHCDEQACLQQGCELHATRTLIQGTDDVLLGTAMDGELLVLESVEDLFVFRVRSSGWELNRIHPRTQPIFTPTVDVGGDRIIVTVIDPHDFDWIPVNQIYRQGPAGWTTGGTLPDGAAAIEGDVAIVGRGGLEGQVARAYRQDCAWIVDANFFCGRDALSQRGGRPLEYKNGVLVITDHPTCDLQVAPGHERATAAGETAPLEQPLSGSASAASNDESIRVFRRGPMGWTWEGDLNCGAFDSTLTCDVKTLVVEGDLIATIVRGSGGRFPLLIFHYDGVSWNPDGIVPNEGIFASSIHMNNGRIVVGDPGASDGAESTGAVVLIESVGGVWQQTARITDGPLGGPKAYFGHHVGLSNDIALAVAQDELVRALCHSVELTDCDGNGLLDECADGCADPMACADGDENGIVDGCEVDCDGNGTPDARDLLTFGDADRNCTVDGVDHARFIDCMLGPEKHADFSCRKAFDFDRDGEVDLQDAAAFLALGR